MVTTLRPKLFNRNLYLFFGVWACVGFSYAGLHSVLFNLYLARLDFDIGFVGVVNGSGLLFLTLFAFPAGWLGRRFGSRRLIIWGLGLSAASYGLIPMAEQLQTWARPFWIIAWNGIFGISAASVIVNSLPYLMAIATPKERDLAFSVRAAAVPLFGFAGSLLGGFLPTLLVSALGATSFGPRSYGLSLSIASLFYVISLVLVLFTKKADSPGQKEGAKKDAPPIRIILLLSLVNLLAMTGIWSSRIFLNVYMDQGINAPTSVIGLIVAIAQLVAVPSALSMPFFARRFGKFQTIVVVAVLLSLGLIVLAAFQSWAAAGISFSIIVSSAIVFESAFSVYSQGLVPPDWRPIMAGATGAAFGIGSSAIGFGGGYIISAFDYKALFSLGAAFSFAAALLFALCFYRFGK